MEFICHIDPNRNIALYQQLTESIASQIRSGQLPASSQLPTVRDLAQQLQLSVGSVKRAYDELEHLGLIRKVQGRGSFVCPPADSADRKDQAMAAIDRLLDHLEDLDFSMAEINLFVNLKLRERSARQSDLKVAVIECNLEVLAQLAEQLSQLEGVELHTYLLQDAEAQPFTLAEEMDLIITTVEHAEAVETMTGLREKVAKVVLRLQPKCVARLVKLRPGEHVGILCASERFGLLLQERCRTYADGVLLHPIVEFSESLDIHNFLFGKSAILLPEDYEKYCSAQTAEALSAFARDHELIPCTYQLDEGSLLYAQEILSRIRHRKQSLE